jgi:iron uptake system component EfeO
MDMYRLALATGCIALLASACGSDSDGKTGTPEEQAVGSVKDYITGEIRALHEASVALQAAAPAPDADGWNATADAKAVNEMRARWADARAAYEHVEGAIAVLFGDLDVSTDARYDDFLAEGADSNLFDGKGVTGVHGIERILWADKIPAAVKSFEEPLKGYLPPAFPSNEKEARDFKESLAQRLVDDTELMLTKFEPLALDAPTAYGGVLGSMREQIEKTKLAQTGEDESRYAQHTLADMRANLEGGVAVFAAFAPMFEAKGDEGIKLRDSIQASFDRVSEFYDAIAGDAIPPVPATWNPDAPTAADLQSGYGKLYSLVLKETDEADTNSLVSLMLLGAQTTGIPGVE